MRIIPGIISPDEIGWKTRLFWLKITAFQHSSNITALLGCEVETAQAPIFLYRSGSQGRLGIRGIQSPGTVS